MLTFLPGPVRGVISYILYFINTGVWGTLIVVFGVFKFIIPIERWVKILDKLLNWFANNWIFVNSFIMDVQREYTSELVAARADPKVHYHDPIATPQWVANYEWTEIAHPNGSGNLSIAQRYREIIEPIMGW